jgi:DNA-binding NtrC family response regulator
LYYRLRVVEIQVPPLRERKEDIPLLVAHLLERVTSELGKNVRRVSDEVMRVLLAHGWSGNVRELENVLRHAVVVARGGIVTPDDLPDLAPGSQRTSTVDLRPLRDVEAEHIRRTLTHTKWTKSLASKILGITRPTLDKKVKEYGIEKE